MARLVGSERLRAAAVLGRSRMERGPVWLFVAFGAENVRGLAAELAGNSTVLAVYNVLMTLTLVASVLLLALFFRRRASRPSHTADAA